MNEFVMYLLKSSLVISFMYLFYRILLINNMHFRVVRIFLIISVVMAILLPLHKFSMKLKLGNKGSEQVITDTPINNQTFNYLALTLDNNNSLSKNNELKRPSLKWSLFLSIVYFTVLTLFLGRLIFHLLYLFKLYQKGRKERFQNYVLIYDWNIRSSFSFFNLIFINNENLTEEETAKIIAHENIHVSQYHSVDLLLIELLSAVMWFNPMVWLTKKAFQLVHEYLADEGALSTGLDKLRYQALLVNQIAEEKLICLSSGLNHSLIKKRIVMMTKQKFNQRTKLKISLLVPLGVFLFLGLACINGQTEKSQDNQDKIVTAVAPVKMNVLYIGIDNPVEIAVSGYKDSEISVSVSNGIIRKLGGSYIINPKQVAESVVTVMANGKVVKEAHFRVKRIPDPVVLLGDKISGNITKRELLNAGGVNVVLRDFDFDLKFTVISFVLSATVPNSYTVREEISKSNKYSAKQLDLINSLIKNQKLTVEDIIAVGPDGVERKMPPLVFTITE